MKKHRGDLQAGDVALDDQTVDRVPPVSHQFEVAPAQGDFLGQVDLGLGHDPADDPEFLGQSLDQPARLLRIAAEPGLRGQQGVHDEMRLNALFQQFGREPLGPGAEDLEGPVLIPDVKRDNSHEHR